MKLYGTKRNLIFIFKIDEVSMKYNLDIENMIVTGHLFHDEGAYDKNGDDTYLFDT